MKKIYLIFLISLLFLLSGCFKLVYEYPAPMPEVVEQKYYETADLKIPLTEGFLVKDENGVVTLYHGIETFTHNDFCDFKGDTLPTTTFRDFTVQFSFTTLTLNKALIKFGGEYLKEYINTDDSIKENEGFLEKIKIGDYEGYKLTQGVEGCGNEQYFLTVPNGILVVKKDLVPELTDLCTQKDKYRASPDVILPEKATQIFEQIVKNTIIK